MGFFSKTYLTVSDDVLLDAEIFLKESRKKFLIILFQEIVRKMVKKWIMTLKIISSQEKLPVPKTQYRKVVKNL